MEFLEACRKFIAIDSTPANGTMEIALFAAELCREAGFTVELQAETLGGVEQANVIARTGEAMPQSELLLQTHLDTVDPGAYALWTKTSANPFNASIYGDQLHGLGSADVKLDFLCKLEAMRAIGARAAWRLPPVLVGTFGEEQGMAGAVRLIRKKKISARQALVGEPTDMRVIHAGKGFAAVEIEIPFSPEEMAFHERHDLGESTSTQSKIFIGKSAHSSDPDAGESAILKMFEYLTRLPDGVVVMEIDGGTNFNTVPAQAVLEIDMVGELRETISGKIRTIMEAVGRVQGDFANFRDDAFVPANPTLNIGMARTYEDHIKLSGCCRLPPSVTNEVYEGWMGVLRDVCAGVGASFRVTDYKQPFRTPMGSPLVRVCQEQLRAQALDGECRTQAVTNEANVFSRFGIECVVIGAGVGAGNSHTPDEHVRISRLHDAIEFYKGVIGRVCL